MSDRKSDAANQLKGTPYLVDDDKQASQAFLRAIERSQRIKSAMDSTLRKLETRIGVRVAPFLEALRPSLVAESNRVEGYAWSAQQVQTVVRQNGELVSGPVQLFLRAVRQDKRVFEALGLYRAYQIADEWVVSDRRPLESEIRALHSLITHGESFAGAYKIRQNEISGSPHQPTSPLAVAEAMRELSVWWRSFGGDPVLGATVVHAWLVHIHPFDDGNGRLARLLANLHLVQAGYPPLNVSSESDRGEYLDALARSDEGDIFPLFDLFTKVVKRQRRVLESDEYVQQLVDGSILSTVEHSIAAWRAVCASLVAALHAKFSDEFAWKEKGELSVESFCLLRQGRKEGNGWFATIGQTGAYRDEWLFWFGFNSQSAAHALKGAFRSFPSIYISRASKDPIALHPFVQVRGDDVIPDEIIVRPGEAAPVMFRFRDDWSSLSVQDAATLIHEAIVHGV